MRRTRAAGAPLTLCLLVGCGTESQVPGPDELGALDAGSLEAGVPSEASVPLDARTDESDDAAEASVVDATSARVDLVRHPLWTRMAAAQDPFADAPAVIDCAEDATVAQLLGEEVVFDVETGACNYVTVQQPALAAVAVGELIKVRLWHFQLSAPEQAQAHALVSVDGLLILDERVEIPGPGELLVRELRVPRAVAAGAPVLFHLHNHGANSWALVEISKRPG